MINDIHSFKRDYTMSISNYCLNKMIVFIKINDLMLLDIFSYYLF